VYRDVYREGFCQPDRPGTNFRFPVIPLLDQISEGAVASAADRSFFVTRIGQSAGILVAGARYVPNLQLLSIRFRSELIHSGL